MYLFQYVNERCNLQLDWRSHPVKPSIKLTAFPFEIPACAGTLVENIGVEPMTSCVQGRRSSQLS